MTEAFIEVLSETDLPVGRIKAVKIDDHTVEFNLEAPNGNFPYLISSDNYNMIVRNWH